MSISRKAMDTVFANLKTRKGGATYNELVKATGYSVHTIRLAVSNLNMMGSVRFSNTKPVEIYAIDAPPTAGQTLVIREPMPALEIDSKMMEMMEGHIKSNRTEFNDELLTVLFLRIRNNSAEKNNSLMVFLINLAEVIRLHIATDELSMDDLGDK